MQQILWAAEGGSFPHVPVIVPKFPVPGGVPLDAIPTCQLYVDLLEDLVRAGEQV